MTVFADQLTAADRLDALTFADLSTDVRTVFSWSYRALSPPAARLFRLLGLHPGPDVSVPATASLAGASIAGTRQLLAELTGAHLLIEHLPGRYAFHDLLRAYAAELAHTEDEPPRRRRALRRCLDHYLRTGHAATTAWWLRPPLPPVSSAPEPGVTPEPLPDADQALAWSLAEHRVIMAAVDQSAAVGIDDLTQQLPRIAAGVLHRHGAWPELIRTQQLALAAAERTGERPWRAVAHKLLAHSYGQLDQPERALHHLEQARVDYLALADQVGMGAVHMGLSWLRMRLKDYPGALFHDERALAAFTEAGDEPGQARAYNNLGFTSAHLGDTAQAIAYCRRALALHHRHHDPTAASNAWDSLGYAYHVAGRYEQAIGCYRRAIERPERPDARATTLLRLGDTYHAAGQPTVAERTWRSALAIFEDLHHPGRETARSKLAGGR